MTQVRFLLDENVPDYFADALIREEPTINVTLVGDPGAPPKRTSDPDLLRAAEAAGWALVTPDKRTMPAHVADHLAAGNHTWGVFILRLGYATEEYVEALLEIWGASTADEWQDLLIRLPW